MKTTKRVPMKLSHSEPAEPLETSNTPEQGHPGATEDVEATELLRELIQLGRQRYLQDLRENAPIRDSYICPEIGPRALQIWERLREITKDAEPGLMAFLTQCGARYLPYDD